MHFNIFLVFIEQDFIINVIVDIDNWILVWLKCEDLPLAITFWNFSSVPKCQIYKVVQTSFPQQPKKKHGRKIKSTYLFLQLQISDRKN